MGGGVMGGVMVGEAWALWGLGTHARTQNPAAGEHRIVDLTTFPSRWPCDEQVSNKALEERHWSQIFGILGRPFDPEQTFCVRDLIEWVVV